MNKFYDVDLPFGEIFENKLKHIFGNKRMEIKTERDIWKTTGNMCVELEYRGRPSGINVTRADYWCHVFQDNGSIQFIVMFPTDVLRGRIRYWLRNGLARLEYGGDNRDSLIVLIPRCVLLDYIEE